MSKIELIEWGWWTLWRIIFTKSQLIIINPICQYWVGWKVCFGFSIRYYGNELSGQLVGSQQLLDSCLIRYQTLYPIVGLKLNIQEAKIMASSPITSWQIDGETMERVRDIIFGGSKITVDGDCSLKIKRRLLLARKAMTNLDSILKSRELLCQQRSI